MIENEDTKMPTGFQRPGSDRDYEIFEGILEMNSLIHNVVFHNYRKNSSIFGLE